ncbi:6035_t:CDS:1, partial [Racocetra fulgida]
RLKTRCKNEAHLDQSAKCRECIKRNVVCTYPHSTKKRGRRPKKGYTNNKRIAITPPYNNEPSTHHFDDEHSTHPFNHEHSTHPFDNDPSTPSSDDKPTTSPSDNKLSTPSPNNELPRARIKLDSSLLKNEQS